MMLRFIISVFITATLGMSLSVDGAAQRTTRTRLRPAKVSRISDSEKADTLFSATDSTAFVFSGYEKTLRSTKETFFATNTTDSIINRIVVTITYKDMTGRGLDTREVSVDLDFNPHSTRKIDIPSWDNQKVFYYHRSPQPRTSIATPYKVSISLKEAMRSR